MKKLLSTFITILLVAAILFAAAFILTPEDVARAWARAGLPPQPLAQLQAWAGQVAPAPENRLYGTLEARTTFAMSETRGRIAAVLVDEGDAVSAGQTLIRLDDADARAQIAAGEQAVAAARAQVEAVAAPPDATIRALADKKVDAAAVQVASAQRALQQAQELRDNPQALNARVAETAGLISVAKAQVKAATAGVKQVQVLIDDAQNDGSREGKYKVRILQAQKAAAAEELNAAQTRLDGLYRTLSLLKAMQEQPLALEAQVNQAKSQVKLARAALKVAKAERNAQTAPPQPQAVAVAEAGVQKAEAALALARWQEEQLLIPAPAAGRVQDKMVESGEVAQAGMPLVSIADVETMELWAYVGLQNLHLVHLGQSLPVEVIAFPGQHFTGEVIFIAPEAQFTPKNVLNPDDRGDMAFKIKLRLDNSEGKLKPGMPADVLLRE